MTHKSKRVLPAIICELEARDLAGEAAQIAKRHGVLPSEMFGPLRVPQFAFARHEFWALLRSRGWSFPRIGALTGHHHRTVMVGINRHLYRLVIAAGRAA